MSAELEARLRETVAGVLDLPASAVGEHTSPDTVEAWDSLAHMNLILALEESFAVTIPDEEAAELTSYPLIRLVVGELVAA